MAMVETFCRKLCGCETDVRSKEDMKPTLSIV